MFSQSRLRRELHRLFDGPQPDEPPEGVGTARFSVRCTGNALQTLERAVSVLKAVNRFGDGERGWPSEAKWRDVLPAWFVSRCAPEQSQEDADAWLTRWKKLPRDEQDRVERDKPWSLSNWIYWFEPANREWYWWGARVVDVDTLIVAIEVDGWPFPWGSLAWLFRAAGAQEVTPEP
jgi:hypothetical protein